MKKWPPKGPMTSKALKLIGGRDAECLGDDFQVLLVGLVPTRRVKCRENRGVRQRRQTSFVNAPLDVTDVNEVAATVGADDIRRHHSLY